MKHDTLNYLFLRIVLIIKHCHTLPRYQISQIDRYQIRTVNIKTWLFFRYPLLASGLALSVIYWYYLYHNKLVISYHQTQIWYDSKLVISCQYNKFKHLNFQYIYPISYKIAKKANPRKWICPYWKTISQVLNPLSKWRIHSRYRQYGSFVIWYGYHINLMSWYLDLIADIWCFKRKPLSKIVCSSGKGRSD